MENQGNSGKFGNLGSTLRPGIPGKSRENLETLGTPGRWGFMLDTLEGDWNGDPMSETSPIRIDRDLGTLVRYLHGGLLVGLGY